MRPLVLLSLVLCLAQAWPMLSPNDTQTWLSSPSNETRHLYRRKCDPIPEEPGEFDCDYDLPSLQQIVDEMQYQEGDRGVRASRPAVFYTNLAYPYSYMRVEEMLDWIAQWLNYRGLWPDGFYWLNGPWDDTWLDVQKRWIVDHTFEIWNRYPDDYPDKWNYPPQSMLQLCRWQALAAAALHPDAYLFSPKGIAWRPNSVWAEVEYPALTNNPNIRAIYIVDPQPRSYKEESGQIPKTPPDQCPPQWEPDEKEVLWSRERGDQPQRAIWDCPVGTRDYWPVS